MTPPRSTLRILSWNIDMDTTPVLVRARALISKIRLESPDLVCLQEVTAPVHDLLNRALCTAPSSKAENCATSTAAPKPPPPLRYAIHVDAAWPEGLPYFCVLLSRTDRLNDPTCTFQPFANSQMFRALLRVDATLKRCGTRVTVVTSHLESLKQGASRRKEQFEDVACVLREAADVEGRVCVFAGDTNLREAEVSARLVDKTGKEGEKAKAIEKTKEMDKPPPVKRRRKAQSSKLGDAWVLDGSKVDEKFTWDMQANDNLDGFGEFKPKARYDKCFLLARPDRELRVEKFRLLGKQRLPCERFISDHWGLCVDLSFNGEKGDE